VDNLTSAYKTWLETQEALPDEARYIPDDGICSSCGKLKRNHPGVERVLAIRKYKYLDVRTQQIVRRIPVPYCQCDVLEI